MNTVKPCFNVQDYWIQWMNLALSNGPNRVGVFSPLTWGWKQIQLQKHSVLKCSLEYHMMKKVQKSSNPDCYAPLSQPHTECRFFLVLAKTQYEHCITFLGSVNINVVHDAHLHMICNFHLYCMQWSLPEWSAMCFCCFTQGSCPSLCQYHFILCLSYPLTLEMEAVHSSETTGNFYEITWCHILWLPLWLSSLQILFFQNSG
jgi:hypothetical protein